jgi:hypothetical protein
MKRVIPILVTLLVFFGAAFPVKAAPVSESKPAPAVQQELIPQQQIPQDTTWLCYDADNPTWYDYVCPEPNLPINPYVATGSINWSSPGETAALINCTPRPECINDYPVYFRVEYEAQWDLFQGYPAGTTAFVEIRTHALVEHVETFGCGSGQEGLCSGVFEGVIPVGELRVLNANWDVETLISMGWPGAAAQYWLLNYVITYSLMPVGDCEDQFMTLTSDTYEIIPTIELPLGPAGSPADDQIYATLPDHVYRVEIAGGPWNDGTTDHTDVAVSWDGLVWTPFSELQMECSEQGPNGQTNVGYIVAESETFYIRVNDAPAGFADNTNNPDPMTYTIGIAVEQAAPPCESQFTYDEQADWLASVQVHSENEEGVLATTELITGEWYAIVVANGAWLDDGSPPDRHDMEYYNGPEEFALLSVPYTDLSGGNKNTWCQTGDGMVSYIQAKDISLYLRVNDPTGDFAANMGVLGVSIFHSTFTRTEQTCEMQFEKGALITSGSVNANQEGGKVFAFALGTSEVNYGGALIPGAWYYLETTGGPWEWKGATHSASGISYDMAIDDSDGWVPLEEWGYGECNVPLDALGHRGVFFQIPQAASVQWKLRVNDSDVWFNNGGSMGWNIYGATDLGIVPVDECDYIYDPDHPVSGDWVSAKAEAGEWMQIYSGNIYAIVINGSDYYWQESAGGPQLRDMQISNNDGQTWSDLPAGFGGTLCYMTNGNDTTIFVRGGQNQTWKIRVKSTTFTDNVGGMEYALYASNPGDTIDPWTNCFDGNVATTLNTLTYIPVKDEVGVYINGTNILAGGSQIQLLQPTETYKVQIEQGPWTDGVGGKSYDADISADNGETWYAIDDRDNPNIICADTDFAGLHKSVYFTVAEGQKWKIRVGDEVSEFGDNGGNLGYSLYSMAGADVPPVDVGIPPPVVNNVCTQPIARPASILEVSKWVEYARLGVQKYFAWCPDHTNIIMALFNALKTREPFATLSEWNGLIKNVESEVHAYNWGADSGQDFSVLDKSPGQSFQMFEDHIFNPVSNSSPWETGILDIESFENFEMPDAYTSCRAYLAPQAGQHLAQGVCYASSVMLLTGASFWIQIILDFGIAALCVKAFWGSVKSAVAMMTGVAIMEKMSS